MVTLLLPCDGSSNALFAVRHAVVARHINRELRADFHRERADEALAEARQLLEAAGVPHHVHTEVRDQARCIADAARRLHCARSVIGTARKSAFARALENSLSGPLLERSSVPVELICGATAGAWEKFGIPAGVGAGMALLVVGGS